VVPKTPPDLKKTLTFAKATKSLVSVVDAIFKSGMKVVPAVMFPI